MFKLVALSLLAVASAQLTPALSTATTTTTATATPSVGPVFALSAGNESITISGSGLVLSTGPGSSFAIDSLGHLLVGTGPSAVGLPSGGAAMPFSIGTPSTPSRLARRQGATVFTVFSEAGGVLSLTSGGVAATFYSCSGILYGGFGVSAGAGCTVLTLGVGAPPVTTTTTSATTASATATSAPISITINISISQTVTIGCSDFPDCYECMYQQTVPQPYDCSKYPTCYYCVYIKKIPPPATYTYCKGLIIPTCTPITPKSTVTVCPTTLIAYATCTACAAAPGAPAYTSTYVSPSCATCLVPAPGTKGAATSVVYVTPQVGSGASAASTSSPKFTGAAVQVKAGAFCGVVIAIAAAFLG